MKRSALLCIVLAALLLLSGCTAPAFLARLFPGDAVETADGLFLYRVASDPSDGGSLIRTAPCPPSVGVAPDPGTLLAAFAAPAGDGDLACALPSGVTVDGWTLENNVITLDFSPSFLDIPDMERTVAALCAALTLCQLDEVEAVSVTSDGQTLFAGLMPEDALLDASESDPYTRQLRLYFPDADGRYLVSEYHSLTLDETTSPERYVIEELLRGPNSGELRSVLPAGTVLRSCATADGVCTVDLSREFYDNRPRTALGERLVLYAVVDSLTALSGVDRVRFLIEGEPADEYVYRSLAEPLERYDEPVGPVSAPKGELDADLYLTLPGLASITALPFRVSTQDFASDEEAVLSALLNAAEPGYPAIFPGTGSVIDIASQGTVCTVDLSESFFVSLPEAARGTAVQSIAATLCALPDIAAVRFTVGGSDAVFDGVDWSGPWRDFTETEVQ